MALVSLAAVTPVSAQAQLLAFPGAEGFGRFATGGRGGEIYHVTNLNDSGKGSLRDAVSQPNRIVVFDVSGTIYLKDILQFKGNLTVLGQTAPGEGVQLYGGRVTFTNADNLIVRHLRIRLGRINNPGQIDAAGLASGQNMIFDHLTVLWGRDENFSISWDSKGNEPKNITVQNSIIGQGLQTHSCGGLIQSNGGITLYRNLYIENQTRNPKVKGLNQFVNNVLYNWGPGGAYILGGESEGPSWAHIEGNYFIKGNWVGAAKPFSRGNENFQYYAKNNWYDDNVDGVLNGYEMTDTEFGLSTALKAAGFNQYSAEVPAPAEHPVITNVMKPEDVVKWAIDSVGATLPARDEVDWYLIDELMSFGPNSTTNGVSTELDLPHKGTGTVHGGYKPTDTDGDGIPDEWENANGLNPNDASDAAKIASNGYANIENYVNSMTSGYPYIKIPQQLTADIQLKESITLSWKDLSDNEDGFVIEMSTDNKNFTEVGRVAKDVTTFVVENLKAEKTYYFRVYAYNNVGVKSLYSDTLKTETTGDATAPTACYSPTPANRAELAALNDIVFSWKNDTKDFYGQVKYTIYLGNTPETMTVLAKDITAKEYNAGRLAAWRDYCWRVDATNDLGTTEGTVWTFKTVGGGTLFYCDFNTTPEAWASQYGGISANTNIMNAGNNKSVTVGDMVFGGGPATMRIVAMYENNVNTSGDYSPNTSADAGASPRCVQFVTEAAGGYMLTPTVEGPTDITIYAGNPGAKAKSFYLFAIDELGNEKKVAEFSMAAKKRTFKFTFTDTNEGKVRYKIDANSVKLNLNDVKIERHIGAGINEIGADGKVGATVSTLGDAVAVNNLTVGQKVAIYDINGRLVVNDIAKANSMTYVLDKGIYLVKVDNTVATKVVIR